MNGYINSLDIKKLNFGIIIDRDTTRANMSLIFEYFSTTNYLVR